MAKETVELMLDEKDLTQAEKLLEACGLDLSMAVNEFLKRVLQEGKIPFDCTAD